MTKTRALEILSMLSTFSIQDFESLENGSDTLAANFQNIIYDNYNSIDGNLKSSKYCVELVKDERCYDEKIVMIFKITEFNDTEDDITYLQFEGRYSSWDSTYFDTCFVVTPKVKEVIEFESVK